MLRNLRNMIQAGIDEKYHVMVIKKLTDHVTHFITYVIKDRIRIDLSIFMIDCHYIYVSQGNVIHSRQFPFRFFSAYEVLKTMDDNFTENR